MQRKFTAGILVGIMLFLGCEETSKPEGKKQESLNRETYRPSSYTSKITRDTTLPKVFGLQFGMSAEEVKEVLGISSHDFIEQDDASVKKEVKEYIKEIPDWVSLSNDELWQILEGKHRHAYNVSSAFLLLSPHFSLRDFILEDTDLKRTFLNFCSKGLSSVELLFYGSYERFNFYKKTLIEKYGEPTSVDTREKYYPTHIWRLTERYEIALTKEELYYTFSLRYRYLPFETIREEENRQRVERLKEEIINELKQEQRNARQQYLDKL